MKIHKKSVFFFLLSFFMIFTSFVQYVSAKPVTNESKGELEG